MSIWDPDVPIVQHSLVGQHNKQYKHSTVVAYCWRSLANSIHSFDHVHVRLYTDL